MHALRRFEDVLMDLATDSPEINRLADLITDYQLHTIHYLLARGVDAIQFGDDYETQSGLMMSLSTWRRFLRPRYALLMNPVHAAGKKASFTPAAVASSCWTTSLTFACTLSGRS